MVGVAPRAALSLNPGQAVAVLPQCRHGNLTVTQRHLVTGSQAPSCPTLLQFKWELQRPAPASAPLPDTVQSTDSPGSLTTRLPGLVQALLNRRTKPGETGPQLNPGRRCCFNAVPAGFSIHETLLIYSLVSRAPGTVRGPGDTAGHKQTKCLPLRSRTLRGRYSADR